MEAIHALNLVSECLFQQEDETYNAPLIKIKLTPNFRRGFNCSLEMAIIGRTNMYKSIASPTAAWGTDKTREPSLIDTSAHDSAGLGVEITRFAIIMPT